MSEMEDKIEGLVHVNNQKENKWIHVITTYTNSGTQAKDQIKELTVWSKGLENNVKAQETSSMKS
jgi:hypothetical protein